MISQEYYEILGINRNTSKTDIKKAYKQLARKYHPDLNKEIDAKERFIEIQNAYEKIINQTSGIPSFDDVYKEIFSKEKIEEQRKAQERRKKERERPKPISEILNRLVQDINQYCNEILDSFFVETDSRYKETVEGWGNNFEELADLKEECYKKSWQYNLEDDETCMGDDDNCPIPEGMEEKEWKKLCKKCFEATKKRWQNSYKRAIDIGFAYLRAYLEATPKFYKPLRKEYNSKKEKKQLKKLKLLKPITKNIRQAKLDEFKELRKKTLGFEEIKEINEIKEVYVLVGKHFETSLSENETLIIGTFSSLKIALAKLEKWESDKEKYYCNSCDFNFEDYNSKEYKIELIEEYFKNKQCPDCKQQLKYIPRYDEFNIKKYQIDGAKEDNEEHANGYEHFSVKMIYQAKITNENMIKERFNNFSTMFDYSEEYNLRKPNTKIKLRKS